MFLRGLQAPAIIDLYPFNVDLLLDIGNQTELGRIDVFSMTTIVEDWLEVSFENNDILGDGYSQFQSILLDYQEGSGRRQLQNAATFGASFAGAAVWDATSDATDELLLPTEEDVLAIQVDALVNNQALLLELLQQSDAEGLGDAVKDVKTSLVNPGGGGGSPAPPSSSSDGLDTVIIIAIVIAALAFLLLVFALVMAWRYRKTVVAGQVPMQQNKSGRRQEANTGSDSDFDATSPSKRQSRAANAAVAVPPSEIDPSIDGGLYPSSIISEDISSSLTAYYRSGMSGSGPLTRMSGRNTSGGLNDAASVSSMESYGYSLDGYASSMVGGAGKEEDPY